MRHPHSQLLHGLRSSQRGGVWLLLLLPLLLLVGAGCDNTDDGTKVGSINDVRIATPQGATGEVNGDSIGVTVSMFTSTGAPAPTGTLVDIFETGCFDQNTPSIGRFDLQADGAPCGGVQGAVITNSQGSISLRWTCTAEGTTDVVAAPSNNQTVVGRATITCNPGPSGDWVVESITAEGTLLTGSNSVEVSAEVKQASGDPVPAGTRMMAEVTSGDSLVFDGTGQTPQAQVDGNGMVSFNMLTTDKDGESTVQIRFREARFGSPNEKIFLVRKAGEAGETELVVTVRHRGQALGIGQRAVLADGEDSLDIEVTLVPPANDSFDLEGHEITITNSASSGYFDDDEDLRELVLETDDEGKVSTTFTGGTVADEADITISITDPSELGDGELITNDFKIDIIALGAINFEEASPGVLFVKGAGQNESSTVRFRVLDTKDKPLVGVRVQFSLDNPPTGTSLSPSEVLSDEEGYVSTIVSSGTTAGSVGITASAQLGEVSIDAPSSSLPVVGAKPNRRGFDLLCERLNIGGLIGRQGNQITVDHQYSCTSVLQDRFGNPVGVPQRVSYFAESGIINSPQESIAWDYERTPTPPGDTGRVGTDFNPRGTPPCDVEPKDNESFYDLDGDCSTPTAGCPEIPSGLCTANPRDGLVTVIAVTSGEEQFEDRNGNGRYDDGEPFWDLGEPYIDANDNNRWDPGEFFQDLGSDGNPNGNGEYDGPNGRWDSLTSIWTGTRILLTGGPARPGNRLGGEFGDQELIGSDAFIVSYNDPNLGVQRQFNTTGVVMLPEGVYSVSVGKIWFDNNLNVLNSSTSYQAALIGSPTGISFSSETFRLVDTFLFDVSQEIAAGEAANSRIYRTDVTFQVPNGLVNLPGVSHGGIVSVPNPSEEYERAASVELTATYGISPGVGTPVESSSSFTVFFPEPPPEPEGN